MKNLIVFLLAIAIWQFSYSLFALQSPIIPSPVEIGMSFFELLKTGEIISHSFISLQRILIGFSIAAFVGVFGGIMLAYFQNVGLYIRPFIDILRPIPPIAWIPVAILLFGLGDTSAYFIVFLGAFFPVFTNTYFGALSLPRIYRNVADSFEIDQFTFIKKILFYFSLPYIFTGLRIGMGMAWMSVIAAELIGAQSGLGYFIQLNRLMLRTENILIGMGMIGIIGFLLNSFFLFMEKIAIPWNKN